MHLFSLDKKRLVVKHEMTADHLNDVKVKHVLTKEQIQDQIQRELYQKFMQGIYKHIAVRVTPNPNTGAELYTLEGYVLSQLGLAELMMEICDLDDIGRDQLREECNIAITFRDNKAK